MIVPMVVLPPLTLLTSQVTAVLARPETVAEYWRVWLTPRLVYPGVMVTLCAPAA